MESFFLFGFCVLDMLWVLLGLFVGCMFCDFGVDVVKLELFEGDVICLWGKKIVGILGYFVQQNVGKRDIFIDLCKFEGVDLVKCFVVKVDILIENFCLDVMFRFGLDYEILVVINLKFIMLLIFGFGSGNVDSGCVVYVLVVYVEFGFVYG